MSLLLAGLVVAGASGAMMIGRWLARRGSGAGATARASRPDADEPNTSGAGEPAQTDRTGGGANGAHAPLEGFPCQLGDVVVRVTGEEVWLAGGLVLAEDIPVAVLFVAPEAKRDAALYVRPKPREMVWWLETLEASVVLTFGEAPTVVEHGGIRFERARRLPLRATRVGVGAPDVGETVVVAEYASAGAERLVVIKGPRGACAYRGVCLEPSSYEVIPSGRSTLE